MFTKRTADGVIDICKSSLIEANNLGDSILICSRPGFFSLLLPVMSVYSSAMDNS